MRADESVPLGRAPVKVTRLGLGLASLGGLFVPVPAAEATRTLDRAWDVGIRLFDTAPVYGYGRSERRASGLGRRPRDQYTLCTKVGRLIVPDGPDTQPIWADPPPGVGPRRDYSYAGVMRSVAESLERLGVDRIDVLHVHDPDENFPLAVTEAYRALAELRTRGTIGAVSIGVNHAPVAARYLREVAEPGPDCVLLAGRYNLLDQSGLADFLPLCAARGVAVMIAGVYHSGLFANPSPAAPHGFRRVPPELAARVASWHELCGRFEVPPTAAAAQFPFGHPAVTCVVVGARTPAEVDDTARMLAHPIPADFWATARAAGLLPDGVPTP